MPGAGLPLARVGRAQELECLPQLPAGLGDPGEDGRGPRGIAVVPLAPEIGLRRPGEPLGTLPVAGRRVRAVREQRPEEAERPRRRRGGGGREGPAGPATGGGHVALVEEGGDVLEGDVGGAAPPVGPAPVHPGAAIERAEDVGGRGRVAGRRPGGRAGPLEVHARRSGHRVEGRPRPGGHVVDRGHPAESRPPLRGAHGDLDADLRREPGAVAEGLHETSCEVVVTAEQCRPGEVAAQRGHVRPTTLRRGGPQQRHRPADDLRGVVELAERPGRRPLGRAPDLLVAGQAGGVLGERRAQVRVAPPEPVRDLEERRRRGAGRRAAGRPRPVLCHHVRLRLGPRQSRVSLRWVRRCGRAASAPSRPTLFSS